MNIDRHVCNNVVNRGKPTQRDCDKPARWWVWDGNRPFNDTVEPSCAGCLAQVVDPDINMNVVQRIEY